MTGLGFDQILQRKGVLLSLMFVLIPIFLYVNASWIYGEFSAQATQELIVYLILYAFVMASVAKGLPTSEKFGNGLGFAIMFIGTAIVMLMIPYIASIAGSLETIKLALGFGLLHGAVKTYVEEIVFRYGIGDIVLGGLPAAGIVQAGIFGLFHLAVSGGNWFTMIWLSGMGLVWWFIYKKWGVLGASGSHLAYNLASFGVLGAVL